MLNPREIAAAKKKIEEAVSLQALHGGQSRELPNGYLALGQFLQEPSSLQRGIHGTAAGLTVLARSVGDSSMQISIGLVNYLNNRALAEAGEDDKETAKRLGRVELDKSNVIKVSETLYALSLMKQPSTACDELKRDLLAVLDNSCTAAPLGGSGWPYFSDEPSSGPQALPTAYALRGLAAHGRDIAGPARFLTVVLDNDSPRQTDISVQVASLFMLTQSGHNQKRSLERSTLRLWNRLSPLLAQDLESNIEYARQDHYFYVRVPWQLYLIATLTKTHRHLFGASCRPRPACGYRCRRKQWRFLLSPFRRQDVHSIKRSSV